MKIKRKTNGGVVQISVEEVQEKIDRGEFGMLSFLGGYYIDDTFCYAHALTLFPKETKIRAENGKVIVTAIFKEGMLPSKYCTNNPNRLVTVDVEIRNTDNIIVSFME